MIGANVTETVTVRRADTDRFGDPGEPVTHSIDGCVIAPRIAGRQGREDLSEGEIVIVGLTLYAPWGADIAAGDQVEITAAPWAGIYDVDGEPGHWRNPTTGEEAGVEVALTRTG
jgi:hypothetical protein